MRVRFCLAGDGLDPGPETTAVGVARVGPRGLLGLLESDLGVAWPPVHAAEELGMYRECLAECVDLSRFYRESFAVDPVGTARTLLDWRREWYLHGWEGTFSGDIAAREPRLGDMAAVEARARERLPPCQGQRLRRVLELLGTRRTQIDKLELADPPEDLPPMWRRLAERLDGTALVQGDGEAPADSDLGRLQALLRGGAPARLSADGSLLMLRAQSRDTSAQAVAEMLLANGGSDRSVVVASQDGIILDNAFGRVGLPRAGFQHYSPFRAASQVLKLALALVWEPLDPHRLLQFLIHPVSPLPWKTRALLAEAVAAQPGVGGPAWQRALDKAGAGAEEARFWTMPRRYAAGDGAAAELLEERGAACAAWLGRRFGELRGAEATAVYAAASRQAEAFVDSVRRRRASGAERIAKVEADRLVDEVARALPDDATLAEASHVPATRHPELVTAPVDEVLWWNIEPQRLDLAPVFSPTELAALGTAGVALPAPQARVAASVRAWQRPVFNCRRRLLLVVHDSDQGRHPLVGRIEAQLPGCRQVRLDEGLLEGNATAAKALAIAMPPLPTRPLPAKRRWWRLGRRLPRRETESYSSLAAACYHPHQWLLRYHARLRGSRIADVADEALLFGSLAHRLFERFFQDHDRHPRHWRQLPADALEQWLRTNLPDLVEKEGAVLLAPGRGVDKQRVSTQLEQGLARLLTHLRAAGVVAVESERDLQRPFSDGALAGSADLVAIRADGASAVLDAKWGSENHRLKELEEGRHLQLAVYGFALAEEAWPAVGYYVVTTGNVLAADAGFFPDAKLPAGEALPPRAVWERGLVARAWRLAQFARGDIEVNAGAEPDAASTPPAGGLETRVDVDRFDEFRWLTGLDPSQ